MQIETTPTGYLLRVDEDQLDTARFTRLRAEAEAVRAVDPRRAIELLRAAVRLWRGRFLEDIDIDRVGGAEVVFPQESHLDALGDLAELELGEDDHRSARDRLRPVVLADPSRQRHAELLMRALLAGGDRAAAIRVFHATRDALAELGLEPDKVLRNLAARAEHGEPPSSLPSRPGGFTGRDPELTAIEAAAAAGRRAVWVSGAPGVGKTGLAVEAAHRLRDRFTDGQLLVRLNGFTPNVTATATGDALAELLRELGVPAEQIPSSVGRQVTLYRTTLEGTRTLVVLDNAASPEQVRPLLPDVPGCLAIVTSRRVGDPDTGEALRLAPLPPEEAAALFRTLAGPVRLRGQAADVAAVVKRCGYLPMPIRVAAALFRRHERWPVGHLLGLLEDSGPWGAGGEEDDEGAAAVRVSYQQLTDRQRMLFRLLGGLPGPDVHVAGAAALARHDVPSARLLLDELHEVSLVEETVPDRYRMLDPLKEFAAADPPANQAEAMLRLLDFSLVALSAAVGAAYPFDQAQLPEPTRSSEVVPRFTSPEEGLRWIVAERDNVVAAIRYAATHDLPEHTWQLAVLLWRYFNTTNQFDDSLGTLNLAWRTVSVGPADEPGQAHVLLRLAIAHDRRGKLAEALVLARRARDIWVRLGDVHGEAAALCATAVALMELGEFDEAIAHFTDALSKYERCADPRGQAHALSMLGYLNEQRGNLEVALVQHQDAARMLREIGHRQGLSHTLNNLGTVQRQLGMLTEALESHMAANHHATEVGDQCAAAYALLYTGTVERLRGRLPAAQRYQEHATEIARDVPDADLRTQLALERAAILRARAEPAAALRAGEEALTLAVDSGSRAYEAHAHRCIAEALHDMGDHEGACSHWETAESGFDELALPEAKAIREQRATLECACSGQAGAASTSGWIV